jgi:hypothetical protein
MAAYRPDQNPLSTYVRDFDELLKKLKDADTELEVSRFLHELNGILSEYFKTMMAICEQQNQKLFDVVEEDREHYSEKAKNTFDQAQATMAEYIKQARDLNQSYWKKIKDPLKITPQEFIRETFNNIQQNTTSQIKAWQDVSKAQGKEWSNEIETVQDRASLLLKEAEQNHQVMLEQFHTLENKLKAILTQKGIHKDTNKTRPKS